MPTKIGHTTEAVPCWCCLGRLANPERPPRIFPFEVTMTLREFAQKLLQESPEVLDKTLTMPSGQNVYSFVIAAATAGSLDPDASVKILYNLLKTSRQELA
jgi:hypothetical protein